jgi:uncharacterized protein YecT (DUF1311 family)
MKKTSLRLLCSGIVMLLSIVGSVAQTQSDLNQEGCAKYKKADARMNAAYRQVLNDYKQDTLFVAKLKAAQRAWVAFRDAHLRSVYPEPNTLMAYGSVNPMCRCVVLAELTAERTKALKKWLDGIEEGDVCSGSVRIKK